MYESLLHIDQADTPGQTRSVIQIDEPGTFSEVVEEREMIRMLKAAGLDPQHLTSVPFEEAAQLVSQSAISLELLSNQQFADYITSLMGRDVRG